MGAHMRLLKKSACGESADIAHAFMTREKMAWCTAWRDPGKNQGLVHPAGHDADASALQCADTGTHHGCRLHHHPLQRGRDLLLRRCREPLSDMPGESAVTVTPSHLRSRCRAEVEKHKLLDQ